jgi:predicted neuraminidase
MLIQPTIWFDDNNTLHSLSRDVTKVKRAWYSYSTDNGKTWSKPETTSIWNDNNSIVVANNNRSCPLVIWNEGPGRSNLSLGQLNKDNRSITPITKLNESWASYPNYCFDNNNNLNVVHTDGGAIVWHIIDDKCLKTIRPIRKSIN